MIQNLVIVESPAKARTIEKILGKDYTVKSSYGHVRDLSKKDLSIDIEKGFLPKYEIDPDKKKVISELKDLAGKARKVWLATDEDREGEAISWHLKIALNLEDSNIHRIVFHEITKQAILESLKNPRGIDIHLVDAQQARRVLDRIVGYELSPVLWKKVKPSLSAGRVQSVAVRLIVEREDEIRTFSTESFFKVTGRFSGSSGTGPYELKAELNTRIKTRDEAGQFLKGIIPSVFNIASVDIKPGKKSPAPPFTTSTLQQEASRKLGFSVGQTMTVAQQLYESGLITYMRTDSVNLSNLALGAAKKVIAGTFGEDYIKTRQYTTKSKLAQEAHEAIRPTNLSLSSVGGDKSQQRLYELIWKRTIASQMSDAILEKTNITIDISNRDEKFIATGEVIKFDGFLKVYMESTDDEDSGEKSGILPLVKTGELLERMLIEAVERFTQPSVRYTEASLVKKMEELGIGRPSTYAPVISTIQKRGYVVKEDRYGSERSFTCFTLVKDKIEESAKTEKTGVEKGKLFPTDIGNIVNNFLMSYFPNILDFNFTANVEKEFDEIARGEKVWNKMISEFYESFHPQVIETTTKSKKHSGERLLGTDPQTGKNVYAKIGKFGLMLQIGDSNTEEKPRFTSMVPGYTLETITLRDALDIFMLPKILGSFEDHDVILATGRFGPYLKHGLTNSAISRKINPLKLNLEQAIAIILEKREKSSVKGKTREFRENEHLQIIWGKFGPYISMDKQNFKIPKGSDPETLTYQECLAIVANPDNKPKKKKFPFRGRKAKKE